MRALAFSEKLNNVNAPLQWSVVQQKAWTWGRRLAWFRIHAWGVCDPGFKSQRPHHNKPGPIGHILLLTFSKKFDAFVITDKFKSSLDKF